MVRGGDISPHKNVRRSSREKSAVYRSLEENSIVSNIFTSSNILNGMVGSSKTLLGKERGSKSLRTRGAVKYAVSTDDEESVATTSRRQRPRRNSRTDDNDAPDENIVDSPSSRRSRKRRRLVDEDVESDEDSQEKEDNLGMDRRRQTRSTDREKQRVSIASENGIESSLAHSSARALRSERRVKVVEPQDDGDTEENEDENNKEEEDTGDEEEDEIEEDDNGKDGRQYLLRARRNPVDRFSSHTTESRSARAIRRSVNRFREAAPDYSTRDRRRSKRSSRQSGRSDHKRRMCRSDSSSTGDSDEREMQQSHADERRFERRKEISMFKARNRLVPMNLSEKDLSSSQSVVRERMRQTGASCSDIDPMTVDKEMSFEQIGGLGAHIQSLKEVVLFPLLYPDVFSKFNINPPKGVVFYGPPGTGKTLVARALANECSKGDKKVAFFMRKGADCLSKWVGESERQLRVLFDQAYAMRPSIIFFDEIDGLAPVRSSRQDQIHASIVSTLLALMDGLDNRGEVIVIGATNRLDTIDPALRRPGRFDRELKFSLPDVSSRRQILNIHTSKWGDNQPCDESLKWIAENTSGYCGADLKYLCTEAVLIALRARYPHIYMTSDRLKLDLNSIKVERQHLLDAMRLITPASRRDLSIPSRPLDERTSILLASAIETLLLTRIPCGYRSSQSVQATSSNELEKVVRALEKPPSVHAARLLFCGSEKYADGGQTSYALPALLSRLDHLPVYSLAVNRLFTDGRPEEAFATTFQSALRTATTEPCILLLPSIDQWYQVVPPSVSHMLGTALDQLTGFTSILLLATSDVCYEDCSEEIRNIFRHANSIQMPSIPVNRRQVYFRFVIGPARIAPKEFDASLYIEPEKADPETDLPKRRLNEKEAKELERLYENQLREFRIFLRDQLGRLVRDRRFNIFADPVERDEAEDYYQIIENPMCLTDMMEKVDNRQYTHPDQFLADINLIKNNALEYNPADNTYRKGIRHNAVALRDIVEEYFDKEFDEDFVEKLEETARLLQEAEVVPKNEQILSMPPGYIRTTRWNVSDAFRNPRKSFVLTALKTPNGNLKKNKSSSIMRSKSSSGKLADFDHNGNPDEEDECGEIEAGRTSSIESTSQHVVSVAESSIKTIMPAITKKLLLDDEQLKEVISAAVQRTEDWPVTELERLAAEMSHAVEQFRSTWDRSKLPSTLLTLVENWEYEPRRPLMVASSSPRGSVIGSPRVVL